jgi:hypothetical protein
MGPNEAADPNEVQEFDPDDDTVADPEKDIGMGELDDALEEIDKKVHDKAFELEQELNSTLKRIENIVDTGMASIDDETIRKYWREGKEIERDIQFERDVTFYEMREVYDFPCKSIDFVFSVKEDFDEFEENIDKYPLCFMIYFDLEIKEYLLDLVLKGVENILSSGYSNPVSTFFSNALIIEGPLSLKREIFGAIYDYFNTIPVQNELFKEFFIMLKKMTFIDDGKNDENFVKPDNLLKSDSLKRSKGDVHDEDAHFEEMNINDAFKEELEDFAVRQATPLTFFLYDIVTNTMHNNDVYLSAYDFIQPDVNLINEPESMDPGYVNSNFKNVLKKELDRFKEVRNNEHKKTNPTIYHLAYSQYVDKSIKTLCTALYSTPIC